MSTGLVTREQILALTGPCLGFLLTEAQYGDTQQGLLLGEFSRSATSRLTDGQRAAKNLCCTVTVKSVLPVRLTNCRDLLVKKESVRSLSDILSLPELRDEQVVGWFRGRNGCHLTGVSQLERQVHMELLDTLSRDLLVFCLVLNRGVDAFVSTQVEAFHLPVPIEGCYVSPAQPFKVKVSSLCSTEQSQAAYTRADGQMCAIPESSESVSAVMMHSACKNMFQHALGLQHATIEMHEATQEQLARKSGELAVVTAQLSALQREKRKLEKLHLMKQDGDTSVVDVKKEASDDDACSQSSQIY